MIPGVVAAREVVESIRAELDDPATLRFSSINEVVDAVTGDEAWRRDFTKRYLACDQIPERMAQATLLSAHVHRS